MQFFELDSDLSNRRPETNTYINISHIIEIHYFEPDSEYLVTLSNGVKHNLSEKDYSKLISLIEIV